MDPSQTHAQLVAMMQQAGLPMTTDNLNRAMEAYARGEQLQAAPQTNGVEASMQRVMQPRALPVPPIPPEQVAPQAMPASPVPMNAQATAAPINAGLPIDTILRDGMPIPREQPTQSIIRDVDAIQMPTQRAGLSPKRANNASQSTQSIRDYLRSNKYTNQQSTPFTRKTKREAAKSE